MVLLYDCYFKTDVLPFPHLPHLGGATEETFSSEKRDLRVSGPQGLLMEHKSGPRGHMRCQPTHHQPPQPIFQNWSRELHSQIPSSPRVGVVTKAMDCASQALGRNCHLSSIRHLTLPLTWSCGHNPCTSKWTGHFLLF